MAVLLHESLLPYLARTNHNFPQESDVKSRTDDWVIPEYGKRATKFNQQFQRRPDKRLCKDQLSTDKSRSQYIWPAFAGLTIAGVSVLSLNPSVRHSVANHGSHIFRNLRSRISTLRPLPTSTTLLYASLGTNIICSIALVYSIKQQGSNIETQLSLLKTWEDQATLRARSRTLALQEHYEAHLEGLRNQHATSLRDMERCSQSFEVSQAVALSRISAMQQAAKRSVERAEYAADRSTGRAHEVLASVEHRVQAIEAENEALRGRLDSGEGYLGKLSRRITEGESRNASVTESNSGTNMAEIWLDAE